ncbi:hypothetical protein OESDEN_13590 [Oesophagostomum dentatum]|uniref:Uncharacterized protein n=1 Tax=Oesophagostomum dentatum TaxID=61180 RepID=A0A0B1SS19_OESDE|nr:hypothetical protein OESDEN_13590 [Oesophagostomum dentatum]
MRTLPLLLLRLVLAAQDPERTCHGSVLLHRDESILPSTDLFCVIRSNEGAEPEDVPIIETEEQWSKYLVENPELVAEQAETSLPPLLLVRKDNKIVDFLLPVAFTGSKCTGTQQVVLGHTQSVSCSPPFYPFNETECLSNEFFSAQRLFGPVIVSYIRNISMETSFHSNISFLPVQWQQNQCQNVLQEVSMEFVLNGTHVSEAAVTSIKYATLATSNYSSFTQKFDISFRNVLEAAVEAKGKGYMQGQQIFGLKVLIQMVASMLSYRN